MAYDDEIEEALYDMQLEKDEEYRERMWEEGGYNYEGDDSDSWMDDVPHPDDLISTSHPMKFKIGATILINHIDLIDLSNMGVIVEYGLLINPLFASTLGSKTKLNDKMRSCVFSSRSVGYQHLDEIHKHAETITYTYSYDENIKYSYLKSMNVE